MCALTLTAKTIKRSFLAVSAGSIAFTGSTFAQEQTEEKVERIEVTGSRIQRTDMETASPVTVLDASEIKSLGATSIDEVLQKMTATGGAMVNPGINNGSQGNASINLRGLGSQRTLVLVNNRRMVNSGTGAASTVDLNTIPVAMIKRVEVLKDGASSVYGSDAVAGVVNIILKDDFEGFDINLQTGISDKHDAKETSIDITTGGSFDRGNVVMGIQYMTRGSASQADRGFSDCPLFEIEGKLVCAGSSYSENGHIYGPDGDLQGNPDGTWTEYDEATHAYNYAADSFLYTPMERLNFTAIGKYELSDDVNIFAETMYSKRWSDQQMAPQPIYTEFVYDIAMDGGNLENNHGIADGTTLAYKRRLTDVGPREFSQVVDTARVVFGVEGYLENGWNWDTAVNYGRNDSVDRLANLVNMGAINKAITEGDLNPLDQASWSKSGMAEHTYTEQNSGGSEMLQLSANLSGEIMELPAGYLGFATGVERRTEKAWFIPDSLTSQGMANDPKTEATNGSYDVNEAYAEFAIPLVADVFLAQQVDLSAAVRYFDYSTFGSDSTWKLGLTWKMTNDLMLRSVASTAFRAPTVDELYGGKATSFDKITHPVTGEKSYQAEVTVGGNENLSPEEAETFTVGFVYSPSYLEGFSVTADYYDISIENAIKKVNSDYIAQQCLNSEGLPINENSPLCQSAKIQYDPLSKKIAFNNQLQNIGAENTSGVDLNIAYAFDALGLDWRAKMDTTYLIKKEVQIVGDTIDYKGLITADSGGYADYKTNLGLGVRGDDWGANYQARYISGMDSYGCLAADSDCLVPSTGSVTYHDVSASVFITERVELTGGINNLLDKKPPYYSNNNDANTDPYTYDTLGRYFYMQFSMKM